MNLSETMPAGWERWNEEREGRVVLVYRPDVFDANTFDPACLPTITVAPGRSPNRPPTPKETADGWHVVLYLEPDVRVASVDATTNDRAAAIEMAVDIAKRFNEGAINYRDAYQQPRAAYLDRLDALTGGS